ncbi:MAG: GH3 auxin-responsive promoter family protein [Clostridia bacterium]|nr:GH3 auxin-responsive promoter family protein [Clostridia bacterium]
MVNLKGHILAEFGALLGKTEHLKLKLYAQNANKVQENVLRYLMKRNKNTEYGKKNNFDKVNSVKDYQKLVPLTYYDDYTEYVQRMIKGEKGLITNAYSRRFAGSSGSTGKAKIIPLSAWSEWVCQCFAFSAPVGCAVKWFKRHGKRMPPQKGLLTAEVGCTELENGKTFSCLSSIPLLNLKPLVPLFATSPKELQYTSDDTKMNSHYLKLRFSLPRKEVSYIGTIFITTLESMFFYMEENWEMLCDDIEKGIINESIECPPEMRAKLEKRLKPNPERAEELRKEFRKGFDNEPIVPRIWPNISWMYGMGTGAIAIYQRKLERYMGPNIPAHYLGYVASEALMAVPIELDSYEYVMLPQNGFYEFRPVDSDDYDNLLTIKDLEVGKEYEVILTNMSGFYRYRIEDVIRVTGFYYESPMVTFCYRLNQIANISGEKMTQMAFDHIVNGMCEHLDELFVGYSIYADHSTSPGHYVMLIETSKEADVSKEEEYAKLFEELFCKDNPSAQPVFKNGSLGRCEVKFLRRGTYDDYRQVLKDRGANLNQVKPIKLIDNEEKKEFFFSHIINKENE